MTKARLTPEEVTGYVYAELRRVGDRQRRGELTCQEQFELDRERKRLADLGYMRICLGHRRLELEVVAVLRALKCETLVDISHALPEAWAKPNDVRAAYALLAIVGRVELEGDMQAHCQACGDTLPRDKRTCQLCGWVHTHSANEEKHDK